jgi:hypothetical protein
VLSHASDPRKRAFGKVSREGAASKPTTSAGQKFEIWLPLGLRAAQPLA